MKRKLSILAIIFILALIVITFILSLLPQCFIYFKGFFILSVIVPFMFFGYILITKMIKKLNNTDIKNDDDKQ